VLFFDRSGPTREVWFYQHSLPEGRKSYTKTNPLKFEEFRDLLLWWRDRCETDRAWCVPADVIAGNGYNLDCKNPHDAPALDHLPPMEIVDFMVNRHKDILEAMSEIRALLEQL
jgi:type I restriction enzyme M protein